MEVELKIIDHYSKQTEVVLHSLPAVLGRNEKADVPLRDPWASHKHCSLHDINGTLVVRDLGSKNGIFLHGCRVTESNLLPGDCFTIGRTEITVHYQRGVKTAAESSTIGMKAESGSQPSNPETSAPSGPITRDLIYGDTRDTAKPSEDEKSRRLTNSDAFDSGYDAYWDGVTIEDNPYGQVTNADEFASWVKGWSEARKHDHDENDGRG